MTQGVVSGISGSQTVRNQGDGRERMGMSFKSHSSGGSSIRRELCLSAPIPETLVVQRQGSNIALQSLKAMHFSALVSEPGASSSSVSVLIRKLDKSHQVADSFEDYADQILEARERGHE